eukprot:CAMPEP_0195656846 /NCGR_PEP_ID=MMETSP0815-20121206/35207_1 /TAXON_ID=97485 /ORGANISM="Prymnesium parvum, Strain Texoma1" /LENGTH=69 /DNA_ID=CAMNT_0040801223 /DNA_START=353 /DNA_END=559 /DNA_ORIENTATION=+
MTKESQLKRQTARGVADRHPPLRVRPRLCDRLPLLAGELADGDLTVATDGARREELERRGAALRADALA